LVKVVRIHGFGGPEVLKVEDADVGAPGPGEIRLRQTAIGVNFNEVLIRAGRGSYPPDQFPIILGREAAGIVDAVGAGVDGLDVGQSVAYGFGGFGGYAEARLVAADKVVALPDAIDERTAAAMMVKGMTAQYLLRRAYRVRPGDTILIHAAAGGVGMIACQWGRYLGATVIGTVGSEEKAELARANGCDYPINYNRENFADRTRDITNGEGVHAVYDPVGRDTFEGSIDSLRRRGHFVAFGDISGEIGAIDPALLMTRGSLNFTKTSLRHFISPHEELVATAAELFDVVEKGHVRIAVNQVYPLNETSRAHRDIEARKNTGSTILLP
jgi:NADPH2:quinone reductase